MSTVKVSVIVPVYNIAAYLPQCLDSLIQQTLTDIEILVIDDGSVDGSAAIVDDYAHRYPDKIRAFHQENYGNSIARNRGVHHAKGTYVGFVDGDDYVDVTMFEKMYQQAVDTQADCVVCDYSEVYCGSVLKYSNVRTSDLYGNDVRSASSLLTNSKAYVWNKLFRREMFVATGLQFPCGMYFEDSATIYNVMLHANKIAFVGEPLYCYRVARPGAITTQTDARLYDIFTAMTLFIRYYKEHGYFENNYNDIENLCIIHICARLNTLKTGAPFKEQCRFVDEAFRYLDAHFPDWHHNPQYANRIKKDKKKHGWRSWMFLRDRAWTLKAYYLALHLFGKTEKAPPKPKKSILSNARLKELQHIELDIVLEIQKICEKHNLTFFLAEGSLLGAIRHQGFIPWDDDMDISMPRDDYNRFLAIAQRELPPHLKMCFPDTIPAYHLPFAKVISTEDHGFVNKKDTALYPYTGVYVDVFPLDEFPHKHSAELTKTYKKIRRYRDMLLYKCKYMRPRGFSRKITKLCSCFYSNETLHQRITALSTRYNGTGCDYVVNFASSYPPQRQMVGKGCYAPGRYALYEGHRLPVPMDAEALLYNIYGNYRQMPPIAKRIQKHALTDVRAVAPTESQSTASSSN